MVGRVASLDELRVAGLGELVNNDPGLNSLANNGSEGNYFGIFISMVYPYEDIVDVMLETPKQKPKITEADCEKLCKEYGVDLKIARNYLRKGEDYAVLYIPENKEEKPWILCTNHLGEARTPMWEVHLALEILLRTKLKDRKNCLQKP